METSTVLARQGHRLLQIGIALLLFTSLEGFVIPYLAAPPLALSVHRLGGLEAVLLLALGLLWSKLNLGTATSWISFWSLVYSTFAILVAYLLASAWGAGNETIPLVAGAAHGSTLKETVIRVMAYSSAPTGITAFLLILWGLRLVTSDR